MALPILDGNQTSTTLATTVSGGAHYPNHIIAQSVTIGSLPSISGSVTISNAITISSLPALAGGTNRIGVVTIGGGTITIGAGTAQIGSVTASISGTVTAYIPEFINEPSVGKGIAIVGYNEGDNSLNILGTSNVDQRALKVEPISLPAISGTVEVNDVQSVFRIYDGDGSVFGLDRTFPVDWSSFPPIPAGANYIGQVGVSGTATVALASSQARVGVVTIGAGTVTIGAGTAQIGSVTASLSAGTAQIGSVTASISGTPSVTFTAITGSTSIIGTPSVTFTAITGSTSIIGTPAVTFTAIALPSGTLTTRFGSVTTANTAQITTAVTNTSRKYLLVQNNQTGTSAGAATIGIGFTPTTTQGIQLTAGASYVADSFVPTGAVYWLGSVTGAVFTIVEG